ncbi:hypothetical protein E3P89_00712 [Wallemia ichthyophaga]|uniref:pyridoxal kinase n=1 Tax=Wallemia ichthyophaga TaxID=245174 RepID=A0A4T0HLL5_WALIC|nr:hypothetical protein E3P90_00992 [Wallemia ichthyophaga]TIB16898.1 hypothetical protein E3P93_00849 [Wallemia ichthyophaga]TIB25003.1 hypothetical protein E3P89_00712 [Wallemia ichthyophaga]TIB26664.1 hypothetical protein E3P88_00861 [Wallemia ichthyophaga]
MPHILSIQSHVSYGYLLGWDVDAVNTVNYSNHAGYRNFTGTKVTPADLHGMLSTLEDNGMMGQEYILTGYTPDARSLSIVEAYIQRIKQASHATYLLDPVMGDNNRLYVDSDTVPVYKSMLKLADIITPNGFEVELLTGVALNTRGDIKNALDVLHNSYGVPHVVISSVELELEPEIGGGNTKPEHGEIIKPTILSTIISSSTLNSFNSFNSFNTFNTSNTQTRILQYPLIEGNFNGVGDIFSALLLANCESSARNVRGVIEIDTLTSATEKTVGSIQAVLNNTRNYAASILPENIDDIVENDQSNSSRIWRQRVRELRLVQSQDEIKAPRILHRATEFV